MVFITPLATIFNYIRPKASRDIVFAHAGHCMKNVFIICIIYQAIRMMVIRVELISGEYPFVSASSLVGKTPHRT